MPEYLNLSIGSPMGNLYHECIAAEGEAPVSLLATLAELLQLPLSQEPCCTPVMQIADRVSDEKFRKLNQDNCLLRHTETGQFLIYLRPGRQFTDDQRHCLLVYTFHITLLHQVELGHCIIMHGALLYQKDVDLAAVLFAESCMGKSTASTRYKTQGGTVISDDRLILTFQQDGQITAQPIPTWSRYLQKDSVNFSHPVTLGAMLMLFRGEDDKIEPAPEGNWHIALYQSIADVLFQPENAFSPDLRLKWMTTATARVPDFRKKFGAFQLCGDLNGHIYEHLTEFLRRNKS